MNPRRIYAIFIRQYFLVKGNPARLVSMFLWMVLDIVQWGFISKYLNTFGQAAFGFITIILGAIILWEFMTRIQQGIMMTFLDDIWSQNFINIFASPLQIREYVAGMVATSVTTGIIGFGILILLSGLMFGYNIFNIGLMILPFIFILFIFGISMGLLQSAAIFRLGPSAEWLGWPIPFVLSIFSGVFYPISILPAPMQIIAKIIPSSYVFESMRMLLSSGSFSGSIAINLGISLALALIYLFLMYSFFVYIYHLNLKNGNIARFNAESF